MDLNLSLTAHFCWSSLVIGWRDLYQFTSVTCVSDFFVSLVPSIEAPILFHNRFNRSVLSVMDCANCQRVGHERSFWGVICETVICPCAVYCVAGVTQAILKSYNRLKMHKQTMMRGQHGNSRLFYKSL